VSGGAFVWWVAVAVAAAAGVAGARALWSRRARLRRWLAAPGAAWRRRHARRATQTHDRLVSRVLERAEALGEPVPVRIARQGDFVTVTYHPDDGQKHFVADHALYERTLRRGQLPPTRTFVGTGPEHTVHQWNDEELRAWLERQVRRGGAPGERTRPILPS
jgi:hypothetical protein